METADQPAKPKPKRRWHQYSLRTLMICVTLFAIACSWFAVKMQQAKRQREAVEAIRKTKNGYVVYDDPSRQTLFQNQQPSSQGWLSNLLGEDFLYNVIRANCEDVDLGTLHLEYLPNLQRLVIDNSQGQDGGLEILEKLPQLQSLHISGGKNITDASLVYFKGLTQLKELDLLDTKITDAGLERLKPLPQLEALNIGNAKITDAGLIQIRGMKHLKRLDLFGTKISDAGLAHLKDLNHLQFLNLLNTKITGEGLYYLKGLTNLRDLKFYTPTTISGVSDLQKALPELRITQ